MFILENLIIDLKKEFDVEFNLTQDYSKGLLTSNDAFIRAKIDKQNPQSIAQDLAGKINFFLEKNNYLLTAVNIGPYINILPKNEIIKDIKGLTDITKLKESDKIDQNVLVDYFAPNIAKNLHAAHIRSIDIGEALKRVFSLKYKTVIGDRHLGDWGVQFGILIWGIFNGQKYDLQTIDFETNQSQQIIDDLTTLYVEVNGLIEINETIRPEAQKIAKALETELNSFDGNYQNTTYLKYWHKIAIRSLEVNDLQSKRLGLNFDGFWKDSQKYNWSEEVDNLIKNRTGVWLWNRESVSGVHDLDFGEAFLSKIATSEIDNLINSSCFQVEENNGVKSIFIDLEEEKLGRSYLISSDGYTTYIYRDVIVRFLWAGLFEASTMLSVVDSRQSHSFKQVFAIVRRLIKSGYYKNNNFAFLSSSQTQKALEILDQSSLFHVSFGIFKTGTGTMSSRKGSGFSLDSFLNEVDEAVLTKLTEKASENAEIIVKKSKIEILTKASVKWFDLYRDCEQDVNFDINEVISFEGNTGMYQLYTVSRLKSILKKNNFDESENEINLSEKQICALKPDEIELLTYSLRLELVINQVIKNKKPHLICNYLFEYSSLVNSWYTKTSIVNETDQNRKKSLLMMVGYLVNHLTNTLQLLAIDTVDQI